MQPDYKMIGKRIKIARIKAGFTQEHLAELVDLSPTHLSNVETGSTRVSLQSIINLSNALSVSVDELLSDSIIKSDRHFRSDIEEILSDCDEYEIRVIKDVVEALKVSLRRDAKLRGMIQE